MERPIFDRVTQPDGTSEFEDYLYSLPKKDRLKLLSVIKQTELQGIDIAIKMKWVKKLQDGICELRSQQGKDIQRALYFHEMGNKYMITHGFSKKTQKTPQSEIDHSIRKRNEYLKRGGTI